MSKETVEHSWDILNAILGHKYYQNHSNRVILAHEANICNNSDFDHSL